MSVHGSNAIKFEIDKADAGALEDITAHVTKIGGVNINKGLIDVTPFGTDSAAFLQGVFKTYDPIDIEGFYDDEATVGPDVIFNIGKSTHAVTRSFKITWDMPTAAKYTSGECWITAYKRGDEVGGYVTYAATIQPTGTITEA